MTVVRQFMAFCIKGTAASVANSQDKPIRKATGMNDHKFTLKKRKRYKEETWSSVSSWHMAHTSRYTVKSRKSLKQMLAALHFYAQSFSFFITNRKFITFISISWPAMSFGIPGSHAQTLLSAAGCDEKAKGRFCLAVLKSKKIEL